MRIRRSKDIKFSLPTYQWKAVVIKLRETYKICRVKSNGNVREIRYI